MPESAPVLVPHNYGIFFQRSASGQSASSDKALLAQAVTALPLRLGAGARWTPRSATAAWLSTRRSPHTRRAYTRDLVHYLGWLDTQGLDPLEVRPGDIELYITHLTSTPRPAAASTVNRRLSTLSSWYTYLADYNLVGRNPITAVDRPLLNRDVSPTVGLTVTEVRALLRAADAAVDRWPRHSPFRFPAARNRLLVGLLAGLALRVSEATGLDLADVRHHAGHRTVRIQGKGGRSRELSVPAQLVSHLDVHIRHQQLGFAIAEVARRADETFRQLDDDPRYRHDGLWLTPVGEQVLAHVVAKRDAEYARLRALTPEAWAQQPAAGLLFTTVAGQPLAQRKVFDVVRRLARAADLPGADRISPRSLRSAAATAALEDGTPLRGVQDFLGHSDPRTTRRHDRAASR